MALRVVAGLVFASVVALSSVGLADSGKGAPAPAPAPSTVVSIARVTWSLASPGGVGTFRVTVNTTGTLRAGAVWAQARSAGAAGIQGPIAAALKPGVQPSGVMSGTANGRCYAIVLAIEPDSTSSGVQLDPKNSSRTVCLDPDGAGIFQ